MNKTRVRQYKKWCCPLVFLLLQFFLLAVLGYSAEQPVDENRLFPSSIADRLFFSPCILPENFTDSKFESFSPISCLKLRGGAEGSFDFKKSEEHRLLTFGDGGASIHFGKYTSLSGRFIYRRMIDTKTKSLQQRDYYTDHVTLEIGNAAFSKWRLALGHMKVPFGFNSNPLMEFYKIVEDDIFWRSPMNSAKLTFDDLRGFQVDLGVGLADSSISRKSRDRAEKLGITEEDAASLRTMIDFPALEGSRIMASLYGERHGTRRYGLGFLNITKKKDISIFEFVRHFPVIDGENKLFSQLIRISLQGHFIGSTRWLFNYDDEGFRHRLGTIGYDYKIFEELYLRFAISYLKSEIKDVKSRWFGVTGLNAQL